MWLSSTKRFVAYSRCVENTADTAVYAAVSGLCSELFEDLVEVVGLLRN